MVSLNYSTSASPGQGLEDDPHCPPWKKGNWLGSFGRTQENLSLTRSCWNTRVTDDSKDTICKYGLRKGKPRKKDIRCDQIMGCIFWKVPLLRLIKSHLMRWRLSQIPRFLQLPPKNVCSFSLDFMDGSGLSFTAYPIPRFTLGQMGHFCSCNNRRR